MEVGIPLVGYFQEEERGGSDFFKIKFDGILQIKPDVFSY